MSGDVSGDVLEVALEAFGARLAGGAAPADARSGAGVHRVRLPQGEPAYVKVTVAAVGTGARAAAERELRFYRRAAPSAPVRTPPLLDTLGTGDGVALLLGDAGDQRAVDAWSSRQWQALGQGLARLHTMPVPAGDWDRPDGLLAALATADVDEVATFWTGHLPQLGELLDRRDTIRDRLGSAPAVLVHGDCHTGNVVHDDDSDGAGDGDGGLVFCDWQESGTGRATADLALLSVRATPSGTPVPDGVVQEYLRQCARGGVVHDDVGFRRALVLEELAVLVFQWPPFAVYNGPAGIERVRRRARYLADRLLPDRKPPVPAARRSGSRPTRTVG